MTRLEALEAFLGAPRQSGRLREAARLYVRQAGAESLASPRCFLCTLPEHAYYVPFAAEGVEFDLVALDPGHRMAELEAVAPDAASIDAWVSALATLPCLPAWSTEAQVLTAREALHAKARQRLTADGPLWLIAGSPCLSSVLAPAAPGEGSAVLPICAALHAYCLEATDLRAATSAQLLDERGAAAVVAAADHIAAFVASWFAAARQSDEGRAAALAAADEQDLDAAYGRLVAVTERTPFPVAPVGTAGDHLLAAIKAIGQREGFEVRPSASDDSGLPIDQRLRRIALASRFRFREVSLQGRWWREEGPPLLLWQHSSGQPRAAFWRRGRFHLFDPKADRLLPIDEKVHADLAPLGFVLYASLPDTIDMAVLRRFALANAKANLWVLLVAGALAMAVGLLVPVVTGVIVQTAIPDGRVDLLEQMVLLVCAAAIGVAGFDLARSIASIRVSTLVDVRLQPAVWDRILRLSPRFFRDFSTGDLARRVLAVDEAQRILTGPVLNGIISGVFAGGSLFLMMAFDLRLALYGFAFAIVTAIALFLLARRRLGPLHALRKAQGEVTSQIIGILTGIDKLRLAAAEERAFTRWAEAFSLQQEANLDSGRIRAALGVLTTLLLPLGMLGVFLVAGIRATPISLAAFAAFNIAFAQFVAAVTTLALSLSAALEAVPLLRRIAPLLDARPEVDVSRAAPGRLSGRIDVRDLAFCYRADGPLVLDGIGFSVAPGEFVAIVGRSGSGKSTLLRQLLGFERPLNGAVFYDGRDLATLDLRLVRRQIGTVLQNVGLIPGSIYENVAGAAALTDQEVMEALRKAGLADDVAAFPMGLETFVSEDGGTLSGGQRQRLMIARALVGNPSILFFDEATSALDNRTQAVVRESLHRLNVTRLVIAHRLSTVRNADKILVLERGRLIESGRYDELIERRGAFFRLAERQLV
jgi:NHLM bacteriocin system ABC transporter ATP-binding protein